MALDLTGITIFPYYHKITATTNALEIKLPSQADLIEFENWDSTNEIYIGQNNQADGATFDTDYAFAIPNKQAKKVQLSRSLSRADSVYVASSTGSIVVYIEISDT
tara:strand:+ start:54 stop:371 length:318 start_codon:yes stop_codon:yes gene_type:complete